MNLFFEYLLCKKNPIILFFACMGVNLLSFYLYKLPLQAVAYPILLCFIIVSVYLVTDFLRIKTKVNILKGIKNFDAVSGMPLPFASSPCEKEYAQIIGLLNKEHQYFTDSAVCKYNDMMEYYTVWAHQIKTPIAVMRLKLQNEDTPLSRKLLSELLRIEQYADMVLTYLRLESDYTDYVIENCCLYDLVITAVKRFSSEFIDRGLSLSLEKFDETVLTDEKWLLFVVEQVLSNALKYTYNGKITICMEENQTLCIKDTGIGISESDLPRVFDKGYTGINGRLDKTASGIGLYLCKRIINRLGHKISISSKENQGTVVRICLQRKKIRHE